MAGYVSLGSDLSKVKVKDNGRSKQCADTVLTKRCSGSG
jgi:hypothetical protein